MPQKVLRFTGINRKVNEFQNSGACEELINMRPEQDGGFRVIKPKHKDIQYAEYDALYEHTFGDVYNRIVVSNGVVDWIGADGNINRITDELSSKDVTISSAGNVLVIYCEDDRRQLVYKFKDEKYEPYAVVPKTIINTSFYNDYNSSNPLNGTATVTDLSADGYRSALQQAASEFYNKYPNGLCGASIIGCTYELEDGSEIWSTSFIVANITRIAGYVSPRTEVNSGVTMVVTGAKEVILNLALNKGYSQGVKRINVYATRPVLPYTAEGIDSNSISIVPESLGDLELGNQLMYYQGSVDADREVTYLRLNFGKTQASNDVMEVTSGCIERVGDVVSYNNRFHYYRSEVNHVIQMPTMSDAGTGKENASPWIAYVKFDDKWILIDRTYEFVEDEPQDFIYPMAGIKQLAFVKCQWSSDYSELVTPYTDMFYVDLRDSGSYNYSYAFDITPTLVSAESFYSQMQEEGQIWGDEISTRILLKKETNAINVSAQYNPFVFPVEYSYAFGGEIKDIATSYLPVSSTQIGQFPLTVFTSNGIFALEQGDGSVLYSNIIPLQPHVITGKATPSPVGTFFISSKSLYLLSGREAVNLSYILHGEPESGIRESDAYKKLYCNSKSILPDFSSLLSGEDFEAFVEDATLVYDQLRNELYISSSDDSIPYSYVFNIDTKSYHKIAKRYLPTSSGARYVIESSGDTKNVVDLHTEENAVQPILLQSRPLSLEALSTHIQRLLLLADAKLTGSQNLCLTVFGSDNLNDWKCIISSQKQNAVLRHIRTNRAAKSYRDYVIVISGRVDTGTDISDIIADYTVVNRRLG